MSHPNTRAGKRPDPKSVPPHPPVPRPPSPPLAMTLLAPPVTCELGNREAVAGALIYTTDVTVCVGHAHLPSVGPSVHQSVGPSVPPTRPTLYHNLLSARRAWPASLIRWGCIIHQAASKWRERHSSLSTFQIRSHGRGDPSGTSVFSAVSLAGCAPHRRPL